MHWFLIFAANRLLTVKGRPCAESLGPSAVSIAAWSAWSLDVSTLRSSGD